MEPEDWMGDTSSESDVDGGAFPPTRALARPQHWEFYLSGLLLDWRRPQLDAFVAIANSGRVRGPRPVWLSQQKRGAITADSFVEDVMRQLEPLAGGRPAPFELRPNTESQKLNIFKRLGNIEADPFVAACMAEMPPDMGGLAAVLRLFANPDCPCNAEAVVLEPAGPLARSVFF